MQAFISGALIAIITLPLKDVAGDITSWKWWVFILTMDVLATINRS